MTLTIIITIGLLAYAWIVALFAEKIETVFDFAAAALFVLAASIIGAISCIAFLLERDTSPPEGQIILCHPLEGCQNQKKEGGI